MSTEPKWTPRQLDAITKTDGALLVSAAAGSGKTAVLAARCVHLVCKADAPCDVDQLLVLTFTRAAAGEMHERIERALRQQVEESDDPRLQRQLRLIDRATITTLDGFCASLVRANFHLLGIDPGFAILAPEDAALLKTEVLDRQLDAEYESTRAGALKGLLDSYFSSDDTRLRVQLIAAHTLLQSVVDPDRWREHAMRRLVGGADGSDGELLTLFSQMQQRALRATIGKLNAASRLTKRHDGLAAYQKHLDDLLTEAHDWQALAESASFDRLAARASTYKAPRLPNVARDTPGKDQAQAMLNAGKEDLKESGAAQSLCRWSLNQLRSDLAQIAPHADYFLTLADQFTAAYDQAKLELRTLDFADTERLALTILREKPGTLTPSICARNLHTKYQYVLVDEFQDINPLQNAILRLASRDIAAETDPSIRSNFFTVGDVKQSIYRFRLAEPQQFIDRQASLRSNSAIGEVIDLQENFRSRGPLLDAVNDVFRLLMTSESTGIGYDQTHELRSILPYPDFGPAAFVGKPIELHLLPREIDRDLSSPSDDEDATDSFDREIALVAQRIRELIDQRRVVAVKEGGTLGSRPIRYGDIAVLLRSAKYKSSVVADELRSNGIPVHADDTTGFFTNTEVQDVMSVLRLVSNQQQDIPMAAYLRSPLSDLPMPEDALATIRLAFPDDPFHRAAVLYSTSRHDELADRLTRCFASLANWRRRFQEQPIGETLSQWFDETGYLTLCRALPDGAQRIANLQELQERAIAFDSFERQGLDRFLAFLEELETDDQLGRPSIAAASQDFVRVMTVHKSKGLEFPVVIVPDLGKQFNEQSLRDPILLDRDLGIALSAVDLPNRVRYPSVATMAIKSHSRRQAIAEEIRVLYVALTRAREHLILIGTTKSTFDDIAQEWADHEGVLPDDHIQQSRTALDWIAPIAAITQRKGLEAFEVTDWTGKPSPSSGGDGRDESTAKQLERWFAAARDVATPLSGAGRMATERIAFEYQRLQATRQPSTQRISDLATFAPTSITTPQAVVLEWPEAYQPRQRAAAMEIGTATHRFMELLDPHRIGSQSEVELQIQELIARRHLEESDSKLIDISTVLWFADTDIGLLVRDRANRLIREQSIAFSFRPPGLSESDYVLNRGRLDALLVTPNGLVLLDYKTDRIEADRVELRAQTYWPQLRGYAQAVSNVTKLPVTRACLVFLGARRIIDLPADLPADYG